MEQQRLFAWSETSGLLDLDSAKQAKVLESNTFVLHRTTVLDLLVQVQCLFKEFEEHHRRNERLKPVADPDGVLEQPEKDAAAANFPLPEGRRNFIKKAMVALRDKSKDGAHRLRWISFDKVAFELLLSRFSTLNDSMTDILDARMQVEIHHTVQDTNRGVLQLHHRIADLGRLVMALNVKLEAAAAPVTAPTPMSAAHKAANASGLQLLSQLAKFKAFNESIDSDRGGRRGSSTPWDETAAMSLGLARPEEQKDLRLDRSLIRLDPAAEESDDPRCEAVMTLPGGEEKRVWIEWKDYDPSRPDDPSPPKDVIVERVRKLAALLNHSPKPAAFRTPHCLGFFDKASPLGDDDDDKGSDDAASRPDDEEDIRNLRLGLVFERPQDAGLHASLPPVSLRELFDAHAAGRPKVKPSLTDRIALAHAVASCLLHLHAVNWLHKGLRSANIVFFRRTPAPGADNGGPNTITTTPDDAPVDLTRPYLSGFDFSRPARPDEMTDVPGGDDAAHDLYRHPGAQSGPAHAGRGRARFRKSFDVYSLGVVLVEIAHWRPVEAVLGLNLAAARARPGIALRVRLQLLAADVAAALGAAMGRVFEEAARRCIAGGEALGLEVGEDETDDAVAARMGVRFYEDVVKKLEDIRV